MKSKEANISYKISFIEKKKNTLLKMQNNDLIKYLKFDATFILMNNFEFQEKVIREIKYIADFLYYDNINCQWVVEIINRQNSATNPYFILRLKMLKYKLANDPFFENYFLIEHYV